MGGLLFRGRPRGHPHGGRPCRRHYRGAGKTGTCQVNRPENGCTLVLEPTPNTVQLSMKTCPACRLLNPGIAVHCDCGYDFASGTAPQQRPRKDTRSREQRMGGILSWVSCCLAIAATVCSAAVIVFSKATVSSITAELTYRGLPSIRAIDPYSALPFLLPLVIALAPILFPKQATRVMSALLLWGFSLVGSASIGLVYMPSAIAMLLAAFAPPDGDGSNGSQQGRPA